MSKKKGYKAAAKNAGWKALSVLQLIISIALAVVIVCAVGSEGFTKKNVKEWFKKDQEQQLPDGGDGSMIITSETTSSLSLEVQPYSESGSLVVSEETDEGVMRYSGANSFTIKATVLATDGTAPADIQFVDWEISDANAGVTLIMHGVTAIISCGEEGFNKQIIVKCISSVDNTKFATVTVDYARSITDFGMTVKGNLYSYAKNDGETSFTMPYFTMGRYMEGSSFFESADFCFLKVCSFGGNGTIDDTIENVTVSIGYSEGFKQSVEGKLGSRNFNTISYTFDSNNPYVGFDTAYSLKTLLGMKGLMSLSTGEYTGSESGYSRYISSFYGLRNQIVVNVVIDTKYRGQYTFNYGITVELSDYVGSVSTDNSSIIL